MNDPASADADALLFKARDAAIDAAQRAAAVLCAVQRQPFRVEEKRRADLVTDADRKSEAVVRQVLSAALPGCGLLLEESGEETAAGQGYESICFVVDPLDGTTNFAAGMPHFAVSVGIEHEGRPCAGVIVDPWRGELFWAVAGHGAYLVHQGQRGGERLQVSPTLELKDAVLSSGFPYTRYDDHDDNHAEFCAVNLSSRGCRRLGAACLDLAWVAAGRLDGFWEKGLKAWDTCAGRVLVGEAGGRVSDYHSKKPPARAESIVATNGHIHEPLLRLLVGVQNVMAEHRAGQM